MGWRLGEQENNTKPTAHPSVSQDRIVREYPARQVEGAGITKTLSPLGPGLNVRMWIFQFTKWSPPHRASPRVSHETQLLGDNSPKRDCRVHMSVGSSTYYMGLLKIQMHARILKDLRILAIDKTV